MNGPSANRLPSVFDDGDVYDLVLKDVPYGLDFYVGLARDSKGPVLDIACGTGRDGTGVRCYLKFVLHRLVLLFRVPTELRAHGRQDLVGEVTEPARFKSLIERGCDDRRRHAFLNRR